MQDLVSIDLYPFFSLKSHLYLFHLGSTTIAAQESQKNSNAVDNSPLMIEITRARIVAFKNQDQQNKNEQRTQLNGEEALTVISFSKSKV